MSEWTESESLSSCSLHVLTAEPASQICPTEDRTKQDILCKMKMRATNSGHLYKPQEEEPTAMLAAL